MPTPKKPAPKAKKKVEKKAPAAEKELVSPVKAPVEEKEAAKPAAGNGKAVLIVEDELPLSHALEMKLKNEGVFVKTVTNGTDALAELKRNSYILILLDLIMPVMDGFAVLTELKNRKIKTPVIVLSNLGQDEDRVKAKELGAIDYFVKSNTPIADIVKRVKEVI